MATEVFHHHPDGFFHGLSKNGLALPFAADKVGVAEFFYVMGNRGQGNIKIAGDVADGWSYFPIQGCLSPSETNLFKYAQARFVG